MAATIERAPMINRNLIGRELGRRSAVVREDALALYARAIGETNPVYFEQQAARSAGYRAVPVMPTYLSCMESKIFPTAELISITGLTHSRILHAEQVYDCHALAFADDELTFEPRIVDVYDKKNGELEFLVKRTKVTRADGVHLADLTAILIHRTRKEAAR